MKKGETADLSSKVEWEPEYAVVTVEWSSSKPSVASVDENGTLTALSGGFTEITAKIGEKKVSYTLEVIEEKILSDETVSLSQTVFPYTGNNVDINQYVLYNGTLVPHSNLSTQYSERPLNIGDYTATITGVYGGYSGSATKSFTIKGDLSRNATNVNVTLDADEYVYEGSPVEPEVVSVTAYGKGGGTATLTEGTDYTVSYMNNNAAGTGYVVITAVDDSYYMGAKRIPFTITESGGETPSEEPELTPETLWDKTEYWSSPHFNNVEDPGALEIISVVSSDTSVLGVECVGEGGNIYDYILTPVKPGTSTVTVTYKLDGKEATASAVYTVKEFPEFITGLTVDGEKADAEVYTNHNYYDIDGYEGTAPNIRLTIADGWVLDNAYWNVTVDGELEEYFSGSEIPENGWTYEFPENGTRLNAFFVFKNTEGDTIQFGVRFIRDGGSGPVEPVPEMTASIDENGILSWESVEGATQYEVTVPGNYNIYYENTADIKYLLDLAYKNGDLEGYTSPYSVRLEAAKVVPTGEDTFDYYLLGEWEGTFDYDPTAGGEVEKYVKSMEFKAMPRLRKDVDASLSATAFDGDTVTLNYSDGSSEVYVLKNWNFISQTTETTTDESARISISYDEQNHVDFASYNNGDIRLRADDPGASYVAQSMELTSSGPVELIRGLDSVTKTDASGNEYEEYNLERLGRYYKFLENDSFKVTYKNGLDEEITVGYVYTDSTGGFTLAEDNQYYTGYPSDNYFGTYFEIELPDQSVDHFEVGQTYNMDVTYHEKGSNFDLTPITTAGKPYSLKITQAGPEAVTSISFANSNVEKVKKGETLQLGVNWEPSYAVVPEGAMTWTSSNPAVATVDGNGLVTAVSEGSVLITAEINGKKAYKNVEVYDEKVLTDETVSLAQTVFPYTGNNVVINQYVLYNGKLVPSTSLSANYSQRPLNIGDYTVTITGVYGGYSGSATKSFTIKGNLAGTAGNPTVTLDPADGYVYSGEPVKPAVASVTFNGTTLTEGKDYTVSYENNNAAGTGYVVITAVDDSYYMGAKLIPFTITEPEPEEPVVVIEEVERIYGASRFDTALKVADELKERMGKEKYDAVILAFSHNYADALAGSYLSCAINAPILLVNSKQDNIDSVQSYIKENLAPGGTIYMLGGTAVVPEAAVKGLTGFNTKRLWGKDRYETNVAILKEAAQFTNDTEIIVASGNGFADSLSAAATGKPILLVKNTLQPVQKEYLNSLEGDLVFDIIGGTGAVSDAVMKELNAYGSTNRTGGATRYETSVNVAKKFFDDPEVGVLAYGQDFPDGLCGGALAHAFGGPLILTANGRTDAAVEYANETGMKFGAVLGGPTLISDASAKDIYNMGSNDKIEVK